MYFSFVVMEVSKFTSNHRGGPTQMRKCRLPQEQVDSYARNPNDLRGGKKKYSKIFCATWSSLVAQLVKNQPAMREASVRSLGWEDPLEKGKATHSSILAWRIPWTLFSGVAESWTWLSDFHFTLCYIVLKYKLTPCSRFDLKKRLCWISVI